MSYLVTVGIGCIGSYLFKAVLEEGHKPVAYDFNFETTALVEEVDFTPSLMEGGIEEIL